MKRRTLKLLALLLAMVMVLALIPAAVLADELTEGGSELQTPPPNGYIRSPEHGTRAVSDAYARGDMETYYRLKGEEPTRDTLPSSYDSRNYNYVTSVKNQNPYGSCWAHAAMASVESYMIKHGVEVGSTGLAATTNLNLSETQHCYFNYSTAYDAEGMLTGDKCTILSGDSCLDSGGNGELSAYTLQRWCGAADESENALNYNKASTVVRSGLSSQYSYGNNICHVQNSVWIPGMDIDGIKNAIMEYGAGNISYYETGNEYTYICTIDNSSQSSSSHKWANHSITVVGWDDSISANNFSPNMPSSNGAWICKNSWGTDSFDCGYCYISYEDTTVLEDYVYFYDAEPIDNYDHNYQYDGSCNPVTCGIGNRVGFVNNTMVANVFTATGSQMLKAVALCSWDEALNYTVEIYKNPKAGDPSSGDLMSTQSGVLAYCGYYTIVLETPVVLNTGDTFSVVFTQSVPYGAIHTPYDASFEDTNLVDWASWTHTNHGDTSYYKVPNGFWTDCPDNGDYRIKAYTVDYEIPYNVTAVVNNESYGTVSVTGRVITAAPAAGYYVESAEVISGTAAVAVNVNTITVSPESDCTVRVNFAPAPSYTVSFVAMGNSEGSETAYIYEEITLPSTVNHTQNGWTFIGWADAELVKTTDKPVFYAPGASYTVTAYATLYALYSRVEEGAGAPVYELVTAAPSDWSGNYVITNADTSSLYVLKGLTLTRDESIETAINATTFANSGITLADGVLSDVAADYVFTLAAEGSYYSIQSVSTGTFIGMKYTFLYGFTDYNSAYCNWTPGINDSHIVRMENANGGDYPYLGFSTIYDYFWAYDASDADALRLWKENNDAVCYTTDPAVSGFYLIGPDWTYGAINAGDKFKVNPGNENEYMLRTTIEEGDKIKVVHVTNGAIDAWYPDGMNNEYTVDAAHAGDVMIYFSTEYNSAWSEFGGYYYIETITKPSFKTHSLVLSGEIGVNFFMDLPAIDGVDYTESYMTFAISGKGTVPSDPVPYDPSHTNAKSTYYGFSCYVNSIQMADTITATFHYGDGLTVSETYSIKQYIASFDTYLAEHPGEYDDETINLVHALADYGHYVQPFLSAARGWTIGSGDDQYAEMDLCYAESYDIDAVKTAVANYAIDRTLCGDIEKVTYSLQMDSDTAICLHFKPVTDYNGSFAADGFTATKQKDGRYLVKIPNIDAHKLGDPYTVVVTTTNGESTVTVSALSYVKGILNAEAYQNNTAAQYAVAAVYHYYAAAAAYKTLHP